MPTQSLKTRMLGLAAAAGVAALAQPALAQKGLDEPFREGYRTTLNGKTVAYVPVG
jgi:ribose transport system substrate-binding protein